MNVIERFQIFGYDQQMHQLFVNSLEHRGGAEKSERGLFPAWIVQPRAEQRKL